jgi:SAM-dependent methyltransferase
VSAPDRPAVDSEGPAFDQSEVDATLASTLDSLDDAENYRDWIVSLAAPYLVGPILEVGAGHGTFTENFADFGDVTSVEPDPYAAELLASRYANDPRVSALSGTVDDVEEGPEFGTAVMINVLEHISDDQGVLASIKDRLEPSGHLVIWVPAFKLLYSPFDAKLGHVRRYRKREVESDVRRAGYQVVESRYVNAPGFFSWLLMVRLLRTEPTSATTIKIFDRYLVPPVRWLETRVRVPFGQSVFLVARNGNEVADRSEPPPQSTPHVASP